jgi:Leucine-rich repeat (LRR) protein
VFEDILYYFVFMMRSRALNLNSPQSSPISLFISVSIDSLSLSLPQGLRELRLEENQLRTCAGVQSLPRLQLLYLSSNRLMDLAEIQHIAMLPSLLELILSGNPLARKPMYRGQVVRRMPGLRYRV